MKVRAYVTLEVATPKSALDKKSKAEEKIAIENRVIDTIEVALSDMKASGVVVRFLREPKTK
jgi:methylthioribose-1-phosphate isomerase